jgi:succinate dehydrogenase/fumarate reductase flavoprotein subunit
MTANKAAGEPAEQRPRDVVVVGSGGAALTAAVTAARAGLEVLLVEKSPLIGGTTALSGGIAWLPMNPVMAAAGTPDSREQAELYLRNLAGDAHRPDMARAYLDAVPQLVEFLHARTEMRFDNAPWYVEYRSEAPGAGTASRSVVAAEYDGRKLGPDIRLLRPPHPMMTVLGGMMFGNADLPHLLRAFQSLRSFRHTARLVAGYAWERLWHPRGMRLTHGNALIARLLKSARDAGVEVWVNAPAVRLVRDAVGENARVSAVEVRREGATIRIPVRHGVVLGSGGFAHDPELRRRYLPFPERQQSATVDSNQGDAARMAGDIGAVLREAPYNNYAGMPMSVLRHRDGSIEQALHSRNSQKPGTITVDKQGRRFANEALPYNDFMHAMVEAGVEQACMIADHRHLDRYGFGLIRPVPAWMRPLGHYLSTGYLVRANTIADLAKALGIPSDSLERTIGRFNDMARAGKDLDFARGEARYDRMAADPRHGPNPCLGPIDQPPFYAVRIEPGNLGTFAGLATDASARVLDGSGRPIEGLYACGLDMLNAFAGHYPGGGGSIGPGMVFGFIAANDIAARARTGHAAMQPADTARAA